MSGRPIKRTLRGERCGCAATDSVHQQRVRGGGMRRSPADSTNRSLATFGKLQHILLARELYQRVMTDFRMRQHGTAAA